VAGVESGDVGSWPVALRRLIGLPVVVGGLGVGRTSDVILDPSLGHVLGFVVDVRGARRHFLPWVAVQVEGDNVAMLSILPLLSSSELAFYLDNGLLLTDTLGEIVADRSGDIVSPLGPVRQRRGRVPVPGAL
jgi:hypothetical protein